VPDGVRLVWVRLLKAPLEVIHRRPHRALVTACSGQDVSHAGAARFPVTAVVKASRGCGPLRQLLASLVATLDALLGAVSGGIGRCLLVTDSGHLIACP
jgi:hypothetical protein